MADTLTQAHTDAHPVEPGADSHPYVKSAGVAGLTWAAVLLVTNLINVPISPAPDADTAEVVAHLTDDRAVIAVLTATFIIGVPLVYWFLTGLAHFLARNGHSHAAVTGLFAFAGVFTMFGLAAATRLALVAAVETEAIDDSTVWAIWKFHDVLFAFNAAPLAVTLAAFGIAGARIGLVPRIFRVLAPTGAALLLASALLALPIAEGTTAATAPGGLGFAIWLTFVFAASIGLLKQAR